MSLGKVTASSSRRGWGSERKALHVTRLATRLICSLLALLLPLQTLGGCAGMTDQQMSATVGATAGAVTGAIVGAVTGKGKGAAIGAVAGATLGALAGWGVGEYRTRKTQDAREATAANNYTSQQGVVAKVQRTTVSPQTLRPGDQVVFQAQYTLLAPSGPVKIREVRTVLYNGQELLRLEKDIDVAPGSYATEQPLTLPADAAEGTYLVQTAIRPVAGDRVTTGEASSEFRVGGAAAASSSRSLAPSATAPPTSSRPAAPQRVAQAPPQSTVPTPSQPAVQTLYVKLARANVRESAGTGAKIVATVPRGTRLTVIAVSGRDPDLWYRVKLADGREGWVATSVVSTDPQ